MNLIFIIIHIILSINNQEQYSDDTYTLLKQIDSIEIREYKPLFFASYVDNKQMSTSNSSFRVLADFIFGGNKQNKSIAMTSPVVIKLFDNRKMLFRMPENYTINNIPKPNNRDIQFVSTDLVHKAVIKYSGYTNDNREKKYIKILKNILDKHDIKHNNEFELRVYDPPYKLLNRRNEISVNIML